MRHALASGVTVEELSEAGILLAYYGASPRVSTPSRCCRMWPMKPGGRYALTHPIVPGPLTIVAQGSVAVGGRHHHLSNVRLSPRIPMR